MYNNQKTSTINVTSSGELINEKSIEINSNLFNGWKQHVFDYEIKKEEGHYIEIVMNDLIENEEIATTIHLLDKYNSFDELISSIAKDAEEEARKNNTRVSLLISVFSVEEPVIEYKEILPANYENLIYCWKIWEIVKNIGSELFEVLIAQAEKKDHFKASEIEKIEFLSLLIDTLKSYVVLQVYEDEEDFAHEKISNYDQIAPYFNTPLYIEDYYSDNVIISENGLVYFIV